MSRFVMLVAALSLWAAGLGAPTRAAAQAWAVLPVERDTQTAEEERSATERAIMHSGALGPEARLLTRAQLLARVAGNARLEGCVEVDCGADLARAAELDFVVVAAVWPGDTGWAGSVAVTLVEAGGTTHEADEAVREGDVARAATAAFVAAIRERNMGSGVPLRVESEPSGALVLVDDTEVGTTPYEGRHAAGEHEVEVRLRGTVERRSVTLAQDPVTLELALPEAEGAPEEGGGHGAAAAGSGGTLDWALAGGLAVAGVVALVSPVRTLVESGDCVDRAPDGFCRESVSFGLQSILLGVAGAALLTGATITAVVQPLSGPEPSAPAGARLSVQGRF